MIDEKVTRFRHQAEHCRRLALGVNDEQTITVLLEMALEYDIWADRFEGNAGLHRLGSWSRPSHPSAGRAPPAKPVV